MKREMIQGLNTKRETNQQKLEVQPVKKLTIHIKKVKISLLRKYA